MAFPMQSRWSDEDARGLDALGLRVYTSRLIGAEPALVLHGGGNTSVKLDHRDHRGRPCRALAIKGSGSDLRTIEAADFARLRLDDLQALRPRTEMPDDDMVAYLARSVLDPNAPRPSIETLLHAFLPDAWVDHSHADAVLALTNQADGHRLLREVYGDRVAIVPYVLPGFSWRNSPPTSTPPTPASRVWCSTCTASSRSARRRGSRTSGTSSL